MPRKRNTYSKKKFIYRTINILIVLYCNNAININIQ